jgi:hypothetical protein
MREYDDDRYLQWYAEFQKLVAEFLDTEGNTEDSLRSEFENAVENTRED